MIVKIDKSFDKDLNKIKIKNIHLKVVEIIEEIKKAKDFSEIKNIIKIKGFKGFYRIRIGEYRIGLSMKGNTAIFIKFLHRKDIYKYFP